ncbi:hypothetical protein BJ138DRAFT_1094774 [Hygrophoropsis aurantiaca]|uniref:Uncharacterized protein n=1 Tax=Hygrophoropsis aurantiaca TaxID=72124 RepID=A0ACB7ZYJ0_9AGAM|nr:hypothetical protein BJ138DRAFT_1094774 [Hygrophoropsis aurantiaca]
MVQIPFSNSHFNLDASGLAGLFGGEEAISAMATLHVYEGRRWLGWYNSPGAYQIAQRYGRLATSRFWDGLFPGVATDPGTLFGVDGLKGPMYKCPESGTTIAQTGHIGALFAKACQQTQGLQITGRITTPAEVTVADLTHTPAFEMHPKGIRSYSGLLATIPIVSSAAAAGACAYFGDWISFAMISLGIITHGLACSVIGAGKFTFTHPRPSEGAPSGNGVLLSDRGVIVLKGEEAAVNAITRGQFSLRFASEPEYKNIRSCVVLLTAQFIAQLLLIPQGTLFGQTMFVGSLAISWAYNGYLSSVDKEEMQMKILMQNVLQNPPKDKYLLGTRTSMAVFVALALDNADPATVLREIIPNDTKVWRQWREVVAQRIATKEKLLRLDLSDFGLCEFNDKESKLLETLCADTRSAYEGFLQYRM